MRNGPRASALMLKRHCVIVSRVTVSCVTVSRVILSRVIVSRVRRAAPAPTLRARPTAPSHCPGAARRPEPAPRPDEGTPRHNNGSGMLTRSPHRRGPKPRGWKGRGGARTRDRPPADAVAVAEARSSRYRGIVSARIVVRTERRRCGRSTGSCGARVRRVSLRTCNGPRHCPRPAKGGRRTRSRARRGGSRRASFTCRCRRLPVPRCALGLPP